MGGVGGYDELYCAASPKLLLGLDLGLGCDNFRICKKLYEKKLQEIVGDSKNLQEIIRDCKNL